jgi:hypothetical protein
MNHSLILPAQEQLVHILPLRPFEASAIGYRLFRAGSHHLHFDERILWQGRDANRSPRLQAARSEELHQ